MNNFLVRSIAGIVFSLVVLGAAWMGAITLGALFFLFAVIGLYEFYSLIKIEHQKPNMILGITLGMVVYILIFLHAQRIIPAQVFLLLFVVLPIIFFAELIQPSPGAIISPAITLMGVIYVSIPFGLINSMAMIFDGFDYAIPIGFFLILWTNDSGAYLAGKNFGRHKLCEKISPNKTWEGLIAGVFFSLCAGGLMAVIFPIVSTPIWLGIAGIIAVFSNLGDLFESQMKRACGVKDSGNFIPGHGGVLDRFDGLFFALPAVLVFIYFFYK